MQDTCETVIPIYSWKKILIHLQVRWIHSGNWTYKGWFLDEEHLLIRKIEKLHDMIFPADVVEGGTHLDSQMRGRQKALVPKPTCEDVREISWLSANKPPWFKDGIVLKVTATCRYWFTLTAVTLLQRRKDQDYFKLGTEIDTIKN